ncbi:hypothetical protein J3458_004983 [Metarhizium acridum]|uniref:uncharacterized protein n=1 Tax=Metarhizium acridum TaxID=92637 RepID=UPI001C6CDA5F|nr:hypothetical protein J3458_004983 [Metarhizium acridum]
MTLASEDEGGERLSEPDGSGKMDAGRCSASAKAKHKCKHKHRHRHRHRHRHGRAQASSHQASTGIEWLVGGATAQLVATQDDRNSEAMHKDTRQIVQYIRRTVR